VIFPPLLLAFVSLLPGSSSVSVTQCGADPTGKTDSTQAFATCLSSVPAGDILVPAGNYIIGGSIVKNRNQNLIGSGSKVSVLECRSVTSPCIVVADTSGVNNYTDSRIEDLTIQGPGIDTTSIGVYFGGDPSGHFSSSNAFADAANLVSVRILGFHYGIEWGNNAYVNKLVRTLVFGNATGLYVPAGVTNSGENTGLTDTAVFNNRDFGIDDHGSFEWMLSGASLDYNGTAIEFFGSVIHAVNSHFEQSGAQVILQPAGSGSLSIRDSEIIVQASSGSDPYVLSTWPQNLNVAIDNVSIWSNHPVQYFMHVQGNITGSINNLYGNGNKLIHAMADASSKAVVSANAAF